MKSKKKDSDTLCEVTRQLTHIISETNGISLSDTLELLSHSPFVKPQVNVAKIVEQFQTLLANFHQDKIDIDTLLGHPFSEAMFDFLKNFPITYHEEHIHLTGSLNADFIFPRIKKLLKGKNAKIYEEMIKEVYGEEALPIETVEDVDELIRLKEGEQFKTYLKILYLPKLILVDKKAHVEAAYHMASELYQNYNVGKLRLKFTLSRASSMSNEKIPGADAISSTEVVMGLYKGFKDFQKEHPDFDFILSPSFRKESDFFDSANFKNKEEHFESQVDQILSLIEEYPELKNHLCEVDTVGDEKELYRKIHFEQMRAGLRRLHYNGFSIRSHHGETWKILRKGIQSVDNAMNIWHIDTLEHGLSLGINPNFYFHRIYQRVMELNQKGQAITEDMNAFHELQDMRWHDKHVLQKLINGQKLNPGERTSFLKTKFHYAREMEHYQHDVLNRMINKKVSLVALPSSNLKLTGAFPDYKDHPFSWWEKKGVSLSVGTDNYVTLSTNYIQEMLILLYSDPDNLKITKLLMVATKETRRPFISQLLWKMRKKVIEEEAIIDENKKAKKGHTKDL